MIPLHPAIFEAGNNRGVKILMEIDPLAALHTTLNFPLLLTQSYPPARISLTPLWIAPGFLEMTGKCDREIGPTQRNSG
jgi:hypothetical protein